MVWRNRFYFFTICWLMVRLVTKNTLNFELICLWKICGYFWMCDYLFSMLLDSFESNFLIPQLVVWISTTATHYPFLRDPLKLTWHIYWFLWVYPMFTDPKHFLSIFLSKSMFLIEIYAIYMGEWHYVLNVGVSGFTILTYQDVFCSSVAFICKGQPIYNNANLGGN